MTQRERDFGMLVAVVCLAAVAAVAAAGLVRAWARGGWRAPLGAVSVCEFCGREVGAADAGLACAAEGDGI